MSNFRLLNLIYIIVRVSSKYGREYLIEFFIAEGCPINKVDKTGSSALSLASNHGHYDVILLLLAGGADINHQVHIICTYMIYGE